MKPRLARGFFFGCAQHGCEPWVQVAGQAGLDGLARQLAAVESIKVLLTPGRHQMERWTGIGWNHRPASVESPAPHRMPAILRAEDREAWLSGTREEARAVLAQYPDDLMDAYEVSTRVNAVENNSPVLIEPVAQRVLRIA